MKLIDILVRELPKQGGWPIGEFYCVQDGDASVKFGVDPDELEFIHDNMWHRGESGSNARIDDVSLSSDWRESVITLEQYESALAETKEQPVKQWKYIKGSENDFVGASDKCTHVLSLAGELFFCEEFDFMCEATRVRNGYKLRVSNPSLYEIIAQREPITAWDGVGLPPVGEVVERRFKCQGDAHWERVKALWVGNDEIFYEYVGVNATGSKQHHTKVSKSHLFRPVKSEADKKRELSVEKMYLAWREHAGKENDGKLYSIYEIIYDAIALGDITGVKLVDDASEVKINITADGMWKAFEKHSDMEDVFNYVSQGNRAGY